MEPLRGWRHSSVRETRTAFDRAEEIKYLLTECYPEHRKIILVMDNLNTHVLASLYKKFPAEEARSYARRLEIHYTPKHGSWLNIAEIELNVMTRQCLDRRIDSILKVRQELSAWENMRNLEFVTTSTFRFPTLEFVNLASPFFCSTVSLPSIAIPL